MSLIMHSGSVITQLNKMNRNLSNAIEKSTVLEQEVLRFMDSKDQLVSEA